MMPAAAADTFMNARRSSCASPRRRLSRSSMYLVSTLLTPTIFLGPSISLPSCGLCRLLLKATLEQEDLALRELVVAEWALLLGEGALTLLLGLVLVAQADVGEREQEGDQ